MAPRTLWPPRDRHQLDDNVPVPHEPFDPLAGAVGDLSDALRHLLRGTPTLQTASYVVGASGVVTDTYNVPYAALAVVSLSANPLVLTSAAPGPGSPGPGPGSANVPVRGFAAVNIEGRAWTLYGGNPGDLITVTAFTKPIPPDVTPGPQQFKTGQLAKAGPSITNNGKQTGPAGNITIASIAAASLVAGTMYEVTAEVYLNGTTATPADDDNFKINVNGALVVVIPVDGTAGNNGRVVSATVISPAVNGTNPITVSTLTAATATAVYHATVIATPLAAS